MARRELSFLAAFKRLPLFRGALATRFPQPARPKLLSITRTSRARAARCRGALATRTVSPARAYRTRTVGTAARLRRSTTRDVGFLAGSPITQGVPLPGTAARVPIKQARDARLH